MKSQLLRQKDEPVIEAVATKGTGVFETLKGVAKLVLSELTKAGSTSTLAWLAVLLLR